MTGKQQAFLNYYLGEANFNASLAARMAGYQANGQHSFESIGSENLVRPEIAAAITEHFKQSHVTAEEVLRELAILARGNSKDKIRALALLSQHHGLLDAERWSQTERGPVEIKVIYGQQLDQQVEEALERYRAEVVADVEALNHKGQDLYEDAKQRFGDSAEVRAFCEYYEGRLKGGLEIESAAEAESKVEIIPTSRRLESGPVERATATVTDISEQSRLPSRRPWVA